MKHRMITLALLAALAAIPGQALAVTVWHCTAHPVGLPGDPHHGYGYTRSQAGNRARLACEAEHGRGRCVVNWPGCHVDHHLHEEETPALLLDQTFPWSL